MSRNAAFAVFIVLAAAGGLSAEVPHLLNYQGVLTDSTGKPVNGLATVTFGFYDTATGGTLLGSFTETQNVTVTKGILNVLIGSATPGGIPTNIFEVPIVFLSVKVNDVELLPRQQIASAVYAFRAESAAGAKHADHATVADSATAADADTLDGLDSLQFLRSDESDSTTGKLTAEKGLEGQGKDGTYPLVQPTPGVKGIGTPGTDEIGGGGLGIIKLAAPGVEAIGGAGTADGEDDIAFRSLGDIHFLTHNEDGVELIPGDGTYSHALTIRGHGDTDDGSVYSLVHIDGKLQFEPGDGLRFKTGPTNPTTNMWKVYGGSDADPDVLLMTRTGTGGLRIDANDLSMQIGNDENDTLEIPATVNGGIYVTRDAGGSASAATVRAYNTNADGPALLAKVNSTYACGLFTNNGTGDIIRGFAGPKTNLRFQVTNSGMVVCTELRITGGSDLAEPFETDSLDAKPGMVMSIDPDKPGGLRLCTRAYDRAVAGIVSGAGGIKPGFTMQQEGSPADGTLPLALTGRVYCWCDASSASIEPGDLLTTSDVPGHAMKVADYSRAQGATIGKAMTRLREGRGLVLVLVGMQ